MGLVCYDIIYVVWYIATGIISKEIYWTLYRMIPARFSEGIPRGIPKAVIKMLDKISKGLIWSIEKL